MDDKVCEILCDQVLNVHSILADEEVRQGLKAWVRWIRLLLEDKANSYIVRLANIPTAVSKGGACGRS